MGLMKQYLALGTVQTYRFVLILHLRSAITLNVWVFQPFTPRYRFWGLHGQGVSSICANSSSGTRTSGHTFDVDVKSLVNEKGVFNPNDAVENLYRWSKSLPRHCPIPPDPGINLFEPTCSFNTCQPSLRYREKVETHEMWTSINMSTWKAFPTCTMKSRIYLDCPIPFPITPPSLASHTPVSVWPKWEFDSFWLFMYRKKTEIPWIADIKRYVNMKRSFQHTKWSWKSLSTMPSPILCHLPSTLHPGIDTRPTCSSNTCWLIAGYQEKNGCRRHADLKW
jgi:hypothetical protein